MRRRNHPLPTAAAEREQISWRFVLLMIVCAGFLATGFFFAARQHFMAMDLGIKNSKLRKQVEDMETEGRRLLLSREMVRSPLEIKRTAMRHGMREGDDPFAAVAASAIDAKDRGLVAKTALTNPSAPQGKQVKAFYPREEAKTADRKRAVDPKLIASAKTR